MLPGSGTIGNEISVKKLPASEPWRNPHRGNPGQTISLPMSGLSLGKNAEKEEPTGANVKVAVSTVTLAAIPRKPAIQLIVKRFCAVFLPRLGLIMCPINLPLLLSQLRFSE